MIAKAQKIRVGTFVVVIGGLLAIVLISFGGLELWRQRDRYHVEITGSVYGLDPGAQVYMNGVRVGSVVDIAVAHDPSKVDVTVELDEDAPIRTDTRALLQYAGITGLKVIDLRGGSPDAPVLPPGGTIPQGETTLDRLEDQASRIAEQSHLLLDRATRLVDNLVELSEPGQYREVIGQVRKIADHLAATSASLRGTIAENRTELRRSIAAVHDAARGLSELLDDQVPQVVANADSLVSDVKALVRDNQTALRAALFDLRQATRSFKELARDVRQRPSRLLFSKPARERELP